MAKMPVHITSNRGITHVFINGKDVTENLTDIKVEIGRVGTVPYVYLTYACYDQLDIEGEYAVVHFCPASARKDA